MNKNILILHGYGQTVEIIKKRAKNLFKVLSRNHNLYFPEGVHDTTLTVNGVKEYGRKCWYYFNPEDKEDFLDYLKLKQTNYYGLSKSLKYLDNYCDNIKFDVLLGFSQGAHFAPLVASRYNIDKIIMIAGFLYPQPKNYDISLIKYDQQSLHIYGINDNIITVEQNKQLIEKFANPQIMCTIRNIKYQLIQKLKK